MQNLAQTTVTRELRYDLTASEIHDLSLELAGKTIEFNAVTEEKKAATSQYTARLNEIKSQCTKLSNVVTDGFEMRNIDCEVSYHTPELGKKTFKRMDSGKQWVEKMDDADWNLFNQPDVI